MTKHSKNHLMLAALALAISAAAGSAAAAVANATSTSTVVTPINITKGADLAFGSFAAGAGTVTVSPNGTRAFSGGVIGMGGSPTAARFDVTGQAGLNYGITWTGTSTELSDGGSNTMAFTRISALTASAATSGDVSSGTLTAGAQSIYVGGVLTVAANQAPGTYTGTISATVVYE